MLVNPKKYALSFATEELIAIKRRLVQEHAAEHLRELAAGLGNLGS